FYIDSSVAFILGGHCGRSRDVCIALDGRVIGWSAAENRCGGVLLPGVAYCFGCGIAAGVCCTVGKYLLFIAAFACDCAWYAADSYLAIAVIGGLQAFSAAWRCWVAAQVAAIRQIGQDWCKGVIH